MHEMYLDTHGMLDRLMVVYTNQHLTAGIPRAMATVETGGEMKNVGTGLIVVAALAACGCATKPHYAPADSASAQAPGRGADTLASGAKGAVMGAAVGAIPAVVLFGAGPFGAAIGAVVVVPLVTVGAIIGGTAGLLHGATRGMSSNAAAVTQAQGLPAQTLAMPISAPPAAGDMWTYRLTEPRSGSTSHRVVLDSRSAQSIEQRGAGSYFVREGDVELFSPHLIAFDSRLSGLPTVKIDADVPSCERWMCMQKARVVGREPVRVPAGEFDTVKVEVEQSWTARSVNAYPNGGRTLTVWYSPQAKRAVKFSSRGTRGAHFKTEFDLELEDYRLN
jgi:hypothetical protein